MSVYELNIDGLVGPTHHYAGLSVGNIASTNNAKKPANPAAAALQGIEKMRLLHQLGVKQAILPPHPRPNLALLRQLGFSGTPAHLLKTAHQNAPELLSACYSASSMWTANAATVSPSTDTSNQRVHFTAANLINHFHRHQEAAVSHALLKQIFADELHFQHHSPLPASLMTRDEGAANHIRLCRTHADPGIHLLVYNQHMLPIGNHTSVPTRYPARQTREASEAIARLHQLHPQNVIFVQQNPTAVDQGVFHNDVIAMGNEALLLIHEDAFQNQAEVCKALQAAANNSLLIMTILREQMSVQDAVQSYFFNSQLITLPDHTMALIAPKECENLPHIKAFIEDLRGSQQNPIQHVHYLDLKQSMQNGGGPACLRLRIVLNEQQLTAMHQGVLITDSLLEKLEHWVRKHYRTELSADDLADPALMKESHRAIKALYTLLQLGPVDRFYINP